MHKQGNWEERLEGRGNTEKLLEKQGGQDLTELGYMSCSYGVRMTWHWHGFDVTVVALSTSGAGCACKFHVAWENSGPKRLWQCYGSAKRVSQSHMTRLLYGARTASKARVF
jgi:1-aminocyclopropane-1-carboxylate deaminase/D-cysteine desulfhydrase-like pyridoxal-dependent ACC family enzyme